MTPLQYVLSRVEGAKPSGNGWIACCRAHEDRNPSLSINEGTDGRVLLKCHAGCSLQAICDAFGIAVSELFPDGSTLEAPVNRNGRHPGQSYPSPEAAIESLRHRHGSKSGQNWTYHDAHGREVFRIVRLDGPNGKSFRPLCQISDGWTIGGLPEVRPLYQLPNLATASRVYVTEGEKAAEAARSVGLVATTSSNGAKSPAKTDWSPLAGKEVVILPDNDAPGRQYAETVSELLRKLDPPATVRILDLPDLPEAGDIYDFLESRDAAEPEALRELIETLASEAEPAQDQSWPDPQPLPADLPTVQSFSLDLLPESFLPWIGDVAERIQCPPDFPAVGAMIALAGIVGRKVGIRPKRQDDWLVVPNLWGMVIGRPSIMKTPALQEPLQLMTRLEIAAKERFDREQQEFAAHEMVAKAKRELGQAAIKKALQGKGHVEGGAQQLAAELLNDELPEPVRRRYLVNDTTVEKLGEILNENPNGVVCFRDELVGWLKSLDRDGQESARTFYLEAWNGSGRFAYDRIGRGTIEIEATTVSIVGGTQPGPLSDYLMAAVRGGAGDDGLMQRFQLAVWPDPSPQWNNVDRWPDTQAKNTAFEVYRRLDQSGPEHFEAESDGFSSNGIPYLRFAPDAQEEFDRWRGMLEQRLRSQSEPPVMESHLAKYRSLIPSLALLLHLADWGSGPVTLTALEKAIRWGEYLESHARRIFSIAIAPDVAAAKLISNRLLKGELADGFTARDIYRNCWSGLSDPKTVQMAIEFLIDLDWLRPQEKITGGRSRVEYRINPRVLATDRTARR